MSEYRPDFMGSGEDLHQKLEQTKEMVRKVRSIQDPESKAQIVEKLSKMIKSGQINRQFFIEELLPLAGFTDAEQNEWKERILHVDDMLNALIDIHDEKSLKSREESPVRKSTLLREVCRANKLQEQQDFTIATKVDEGSSGYQLFLLDRLNKMVLVCDEEGNSSYIIHSMIDNPSQLLDLNKDELDRLAKINPELVTRMQWPGRDQKEKALIWKERMSAQLTSADKGKLDAEEWQKLITQAREELKKIAESDPHYIQVQDFLDSLPDERLEKEIVMDLYHEFLKKYSIEERDYDYHAFSNRVLLKKREKGIGQKYKPLDSGIRAEMKLFFTSLDNAELDKGRGSLRRMFIARYGYTEDDCSVRQIETRLRKERIRRGLGDKIKKISKETEEKLISFLQALTRQQIADWKITTQLYEQFLKDNGLNTDDCSYRIYQRRLEKVRKEAGIQIEGVTNPAIIRQIETYISTFSAEELAKGIHGESYQRFLNEHSLEQDDCSYDTFLSVLRRLRKRKGIKPQGRPSRVALELLREYINALSDEELQTFGRLEQRYRSFMKDNGLSEDDMSRRRFSSELTKKRKGRKN